MVKNQYRTKRKRRFPFKTIFFGGLFFCFCIALVYFLIWSPYFWIKEIEIQSEKKARYYSKEEIEEITQNVLEEKFWQLIPQKSLFLVSLQSIKENVFNKFPEIGEVQISRKLPHSLSILIKERESIGTWCQIEYLEEKKLASTTPETRETRERRVKKCFNIDKEGVIFKESPLIHSNFVLNIYQEKIESVNLRERVTNSEVTESILKIKNDLEKIELEENYSLSIIDFEIISNKDLRVKTNLNFNIYFNPNHSIESQLKTLELVINDQIKSELINLEYIDLRIEGRIYYR